MLKAYLLRQDGKLDAWVIGGAFARFRKRRVVKGKLDLDDGTHIVDPRLYVRVDYYPWWLRWPLTIAFGPREIPGQFWDEGSMTPKNLTNDEAVRTSARELEFASKNRQLSFLSDGQPQWLIIVLCLVGGLIGGFLMGRA